MPTLREKAVLVSLSIHTWSGRKLDRKVTGEVIEKHKAAADAGRFNKLLVSKSYLAPIVTAENKLRADHYKMTLPWDDKNWRLLPAEAFWEHTEIVRKGREALLKSAESLFANWEAIVEERRAALNGMFSRTDYPPLSRLREKFSVTVDHLPLPSGDDIRINVEEGQLQDMQSEVDKMVESRLFEANLHLWSMLLEAVQRFAAAMQPKARLYDTAITSINDLCKTTPKLNLSKDADLDQVVGDIYLTLGSYAPDHLRIGKHNPNAESARAFALMEAEHFIETIKHHIHNRLHGTKDTPKTTCQTN